MTIYYIYPSFLLVITNYPTLFSITKKYRYYQKIARLIDRRRQFRFTSPSSGPVSYEISPLSCC